MNRLLGDPSVYPTIPAQDIERAKAFYSEQLGLDPTEELEDGTLVYITGGSRFELFASSGAAAGTHTQMSFDVKDIDAVVRDLKGRGVEFEEYDFPGLKTIEGIADLKQERAAWFRDSEGNLLALGEKA